MRTLILSLATLALAGAASAQSVSPELAKVIEAAKTEKELDLANGGEVLGGTMMADRVKDGMKKMFAIDFDMRVTPGGPMGVVGNKIATEFRAGQPASTDAWVGAAPQVVPLMKLDMFHVVAWDKLLPNRIRPELIEANGTALRLTTGVPGILYNKKIGADFAKVKTLDDLLKPEYKGKYATTTFAAAFDVLAAKSVWGEAKTIDYVEKLAKNAGGLINCGDTGRLVSGEYPALALDCGGGAINNPTFKDHVALQVVADNAQNRPYYILVPKNARHPNLAILYTVYMSTPEGQAITAHSWGNDLYEYEGTERNKFMKALEAQGIKFRDISIKWWLENPGIDESNNKLARTVRAAAAK
jgi:ABC-type Fe3+ transport system substrate-binding protein